MANETKAPALGSPEMAATPGATDKYIKKGQEIPKLKFKNEQEGKDGVNHKRYGLITAVHLENDKVRKALLNYDIETGSDFCKEVLTKA